MMNGRYGSTLIELMVTLAIMAIVASVVTLALKPRDPATPDTVAQIAAARRAALSSRRPVTIEVVFDRAPVALTALPDGGVVADSSLGVDRLTGEKTHARP